MIQNNDTIAAISTAMGEAAIGIVRITGPKTKNILSSIFTATTPNNGHFKNTVGWIIDPKDGKKADQVVVMYSDAPATYTGEDIAEINCHGGPVVLRNVLRIIMDLGARLADRGEFTKRAFLNGKIDLIQAEAVIDAIRAKSESASKGAIERLSGRSSEEIAGIREILIELLAETEASIDFPEEIEEPKITAIKPKIEALIKRLDNDIAFAECGKIINDGIRVAIVGKPNVGKSSIFNTLMNTEKAIVTDIPGTTTDLIEGVLDIDGFPFVFHDTAGIRAARNKIEEKGIEKTCGSIDNADIVIRVFDISEQFDKNDEGIINWSKHKAKVVSLLNKCDKPQALDEARFKGNGTMIKSSTITGEGLEKLKKQLISLALPDGFSIEQSSLLANLRQIEELKDARKALSNATETIGKGMPLDILTIDIKDAIAALSRIGGEQITDDIIDRVFSNFCVGK